MSEYDYPRKEEMDTYLKWLKEIAKSNVQNFSHGIVYNTLCSKNLKPNELVNGSLNGISVYHMFESWTKRYSNSKNTYSFNPEDWKYFQVFRSKKATRQKEYIKIYIPLDYEHLYQGSNILFDFLDSENIIHESKISSKMRVDNVIVRIAKNDTIGLQKIINFIRNNNYISTGLNKVNPFIPTINGLGYMTEHGNSYNSDISHYIHKYIEICISNDLEVGAEHFKSFLNYCKNNQKVFGDGPFDPTLFDVFDEAYTGRRHRKLNSNETISKMSKEQKMALFIDSLKVTFAKYGIHQVKCAIREIINNGNYSYISNGDKLCMRSKLIDNVSKEEVKDFVDVVINNGVKEKRHTDINDRISTFCELQFLDTLPLMLDEICSVTLENHGQEWLEEAINEFVRYGHIQAFSRYKKGDNRINYRENMKYFDRESFYRLLMKSLKLKGVDTTGVSVDKISELYSSVLSSSKYASVNETPMALN